MPGRSGPSTGPRDLLARRRLGGMCVQCIAGAMTAGATATGARAWLIARYGHLLTPRRKRAITGLLLTTGVLAAGLAGPTP